MISPDLRRPIAEDDLLWTPDMDTALPIRGEDIPGFTAWVNCNGFTLDRETRRGNDGFGFGAYLRDDGAMVLGLPSETPIRAVADGVVVQTMDSDMMAGPYTSNVTVEHGGHGNGLYSNYYHVEPMIAANKKVRQGDILGTLYKDKSFELGRLVHLHLMLIDGWGTHGTSPGGLGMHLRAQDPGMIDPSIYDITSEHQGWEPFDPVQTLGASALEIAHFDTVRINGFIWTR